MEQVTPEVEQPTLEQLAAQFKVEERLPPQSVPQAAPPKPEDPDELARWSAQRYEEITQHLSSLQENLTRKERDEYVSSQMKALDEAISQIGNDVPISKMLIEGALHTKYARDENFRKIFDNRDQNPTAYKKALTILSDEIKKEAAIKYDPQVAEDAKALNQLQRSARTGKSVDDAQDKWRNMSAADFDREWGRLLRG
jgi:hypothetical protein